jgi:hypothetical protein
MKFEGKDLKYQNEEAYYGHEFGDLHEKRE